MNTKTVFRYVLSMSAGLWLVPMPAGADFILELHNGRQVTVERYEDDGEKIAIQTDLGTIGFRKADVKQIIEVAAPQGLRGPLGETVGRPAASKRAVASDMAEGQPAQAGADKTGEAGQDTETQQEMLTPAQIAQIDQQFQKVDRSYKNLWAKHKQQVRAGASNEELMENRKRLLAWDEERQVMRNTIREQAGQEDFPEWVR